MSDALGHPPLPILDYPSINTNRRHGHALKAALAPPHWLGTGIASVAMLAFVWESRVPGYESGGGLLALAALFFLTVWIAVRLALLVVVAAVHRVRPHPLLVYWKRWAFIPLSFAFAFVAVRTNWIAELVFELHREHMKQAALAVLEDPSSAPKSMTIGLYTFNRVATHEKGTVSFLAIVGSWNYAFVYSETPVKGNIDEHWWWWSND